MKPRNYTLTCLNIANRARESGFTPKRLKLLNWGENPSTKGPIVLNAFTAQVMPLLQRELGLDRVALDFEHNTVPGSDAWKNSKDPRPVAAHGVPLLVLNDGLYLDDLVWTEEGRKNADNYPDLSPCVARGSDGAMLFCHSAALTMTGSVYGLEFFSVPMVPVVKQEEAEMEKWLLALLGLEAGATDEQVAAQAKKMGLALTALSAAKPETLRVLLALPQGTLTALSAAKPETVTALLALDAGALTALSAQDAAGLKAKLELLGQVGEGAKATIEGLATRLAKTEGQLLSFSAAYSKAQRDAILAEALKAGKVVPLSAEQVASMPMETLREMVSKLPATVPLDQRTPETFAVDHSRSIGGGDAAAIAAKFGHTEKELTAAGL